MSGLPTTYAHYRFGRDVLAGLPEETQDVIRRHRELFDFGVHGPDLLFYYRPLWKNRVNRTGRRDHARTGRDFFTEAIGHVREAADPDAARSYLYGVLCHFALDRCCHPYVGQKERQGVSHSAIEASFDRYLLLKDGLDPVTHRVTAHLRPSRASAEVIRDFYPPLTGGQVLHAEREMRLILNGLIAKGAKRAVLLFGMRITGLGRLGDMFIPYAQIPECVDSDEILFRHYIEALAMAQTLFPELDAALAGEGDLGPGYDHTFGET